MADATVYYDPTAAGGGTGTSGSPYNDLASITPVGKITAGATLTVRFRNGMGAAKANQYLLMDNALWAASKMDLVPDVAGEWLNLSYSTASDYVIRHQPAAGRATRISMQGVRPTFTALNCNLMNTIGGSIGATDLTIRDCVATFPSGSASNEIFIPTVGTTGKCSVYDSTISNFTRVISGPAFGDIELRGNALNYGTTSGNTILFNVTSGSVPSFGDITSVDNVWTQLAASTNAFFAQYPYLVTKDVLWYFLRDRFVGHASQTGWKFFDVDQRMTSSTKRLKLRMEGCEMSHKSTSILMRCGVDIAAGAHTTKPRAATVAANPLAGGIDVEIVKSTIENTGDGAVAALRCGPKVKLVKSKLLAPNSTAHTVMLWADDPAIESCRIEGLALGLLLYSSRPVVRRTFCRALRPLICGVTGGGTGSNSEAPMGQTIGGILGSGLGNFCWTTATAAVDVATAFGAIDYSYVSNGNDVYNPTTYTQDDGSPGATVPIHRGLVSRGNVYYAPNGAKKVRLGLKATSANDKGYDTTAEVVTAWQTGGPSGIPLGPVDNDADSLCTADLNEALAFMQQNGLGDETWPIYSTPNLIIPGNGF